MKYRKKILYLLVFTLFFTFNFNVIVYATSGTLVSTATGTPTDYQIKSPFYLLMLMIGAKTITATSASIVDKFVDNNKDYVLQNLKTAANGAMAISSDLINTFKQYVTEVYNGNTNTVYDIGNYKIIDLYTLKYNNTLNGFTYTFPTPVDGGSIGANLSGGGYQSFSNAGTSVSSVLIQLASNAYFVYAVKSDGTKVSQGYCFYGSSTLASYLYVPTNLKNDFPDGIGVDVIHPGSTDIYSSRDGDLIATPTYTPGATALGNGYPVDSSNVPVVGLPTVIPWITDDGILNPDGTVSDVPTDTTTPGDTTVPSDTTGFWTSLWDWLKQILEAIKSIPGAIGSILEQLINAVKDIPQKISDSIPTDSTPLDPKNKGIPDLFNVLILILIALINLFLKCLQMIIALRSVPSDSSILNEYTIQAVNFLKTVQLNGFNMTFFDIVTGLIFSIQVFAVIKLLRKYIHREFGGM